MPSKRIVVVGLDFSERDRTAIETALIQATLAPTELHAVYVLQSVSGIVITAEEGPAALPGYTKRLADHLAKTIAAVLDGADAPTGLSTVAHSAFGDPSRMIVHLAAHLDADLVVVGTHGRRGVGRFVLGSIAELVVRRAGCPVLVARTQDHGLDESVPEIEPMCPQCVTRRHASGGQELWCARHSEQHPRPHTYHYEQMSNAPARPWGFGRQVPRR